VNGDHVIRFDDKSLFIIVASALVAACGEDRAGTARFTTWGEDYIEQQIPADPAGEAGFVDGWTLHYDKFLVAFHGIVVANDKGEIAAAMTGSRLVDNARPGKKDLVTFPGVDAAAWNRVSYQIKPAVAGADLVGATAADLDMMVAKGYSLYVEGSASKTDTGGAALKKTFHWGFSSATQYKECQQAAESGNPIQGIVVTSGGTDVSELTTHGDHLYYDRLKASPDPAVKTVLRFDEKAAADRDHDGEISLAELNATPIDVRKYDPSGFDAPTLGAFMTSLARTVGHFRGEGECSISEIK
jgi:hypothetical protein